jgi:hypothetical protein
MGLAPRRLPLRAHRRFARAEECGALAETKADVADGFAATALLQFSQDVDPFYPFLYS